MQNNKTIDINAEREQALTDVINQLDLKDNPHGINDVIEVEAEFWNRATALTKSVMLSKIDSLIDSYTANDPQGYEEIIDGLRRAKDVISGVK